MATKEKAQTSAGLGLSEPRLFRQQAYVNGEWIDADSGETIRVNNPATGAHLADVPKLGTAEVRRAIEGAEAAFPAWRDLIAKERAAVLRRFYELMVEHQEDLAIILTSEQGKPLAEARGEIVYAASFLEWFGEEAKRVYGDTIPAHQADKRIVVLKQPIGVCAGITPWNFPSGMLTRKAAPALAAGCTFVLKPASATPLSALALCELAEEAGMPPGVLSVVTGSAREIGAEMTSNPTVRKLGFTGSTEIGKILMAQCADTVKKVSLELGGNAPFIVFDDADIDAAVEGAIMCKFRNAGQTCVCANRILVQDGVYDEFAEKLVEATRKLVVLPGLDDGSQVGPLIDDAAIEKVEQHVENAVGNGAELLTGGEPHELGGTFYQPTVLSNVNTDMDLSCEETFGPVAGLIRFSTEEEGIAIANDTEYGLASYFYATDHGRVWRVSEALESGIVGVNTGIISTEVAPFGGMKESGIGREGSKYGIDDWVEIKYICMGGI
jgi:succinate-semialdehyde dehydrogenase/glutarate-semialdehyde dehydrogenase